MQKISQFAFFRMKFFAAAGISLAFLAVFEAAAA